MIKIIPSITRVSLGLALVLLSTSIKIFIGPIPLTLQTITFFFISYSLLSLEKNIIFFLFLLLGSLGIVNSASEVSFLTSPTLGYLLGMFIGSFFVSKIENTCKAWLLYLASTYVFGLAYLNIFYSFHQTLMIGFYPFILPELIKTIAVVSFKK